MWTEDAGGVLRTMSEGSYGFYWPSHVYFIHIARILYLMILITCILLTFLMNVFGFIWIMHPVCFVYSSWFSICFLMVQRICY